MIIYNKKGTRNFIAKAQIAGILFAGGSKTQLESEDTYVMAAGLGLGSYLHTQGDLKVGIKTIIGTVASLTVVNGVRTVAENYEELCSKWL